MAIEHDLKPFEARGRDKERAFTNEYVVSVFQRLGFSVVYNHGQRERGRDLILGFLDGLAHFVYSGLQVKFEPSIGIGADSRDLANDARQAFTHPFTHPQTGDEYWISRFYIVNAGSLSDDAKDDVRRQIDNRAIASNTVIIDGPGIVNLNRLAAFSRGNMTTERLTGLMLEVEMNRTVSERLMKHLADFVAGGAYPLQRLRASATVAFLEQPLIMDVKFLNDLHKYWMISGMINQMADSADVTIGGADFARKRAQTAIEKIPEQTAIGLEIQKFAAAALIKLGVTTLRD